VDMKTKERLQTLRGHYRSMLDSRMGEASLEYEMSAVETTLKKIGSSDIPMGRALQSLKLIIAGKGLKAPLIWLGLAPVPAMGSQWMGNASTGRFRIDRDEYMGMLAKTLLEA
jgi:hypothetical protein